jgi:hypothetical protein
MIIDSDQACGHPQLVCEPGASHLVQELEMAKKKAAPGKSRKVIKSADDGQFKSEDFAKAHPKSTYRQTVVEPKKSKK